MKRSSTSDVKSLSEEGFISNWHVVRHTSRAVEGEEHVFIEAKAVEERRKIRGIACLSTLEEESPSFALS